MSSMFRTRKGVQIMNPNKVNQDRVLIEENIDVQENSYNLYAVADGHGAFGHFVSHFLVSYLKQKMIHHLSLSKTMNTKKSF